MPSLTADAGSFALTGFGLPHRLFAGTGSFGLEAQNSGLGRALTIDFDLPASIRLQRLQSALPFVSDGGNPTTMAMRWWQEMAERIEDAYGALAQAVTTIQAAYNAAAEATTNATEARSVAETARTAVETVTETVEQIRTGEVALEKINVGGQNYVSSGGNLIAEP